MESLRPAGEKSPDQIAKLDVRIDRAIDRLDTPAESCAS